MPGVQPVPILHTVGISRRGREMKSKVGVSDSWRTNLIGPLHMPNAGARGRSVSAEDADIVLIIARVCLPYDFHIVRSGRKMRQGERRGNHPLRAPGQVGIEAPFVSRVASAARPADGGNTATGAIDADGED